MGMVCVGGSDRDLTAGTGVLLMVVRAVADGVDDMGMVMKVGGKLERG